MNIIIDDLTHPKVHALLQEHLAGMYANSPACSVHALGIEKLKAPEITFFTAWDGQDLLACGALKALSSSQGELKSMRTSHQHLRRGAAQAILDAIITTAKNRGYQGLSLETGTSPAFAAAIALYQKNGFVQCGPFAGYVVDPFSMFMTLNLAAPSANP